MVSGPKHWDRSGKKDHLAAAPVRRGCRRSGTPTATAAQGGPERPIRPPRPSPVQLPGSNFQRSRVTSTPGGSAAQKTGFSSPK
ncbi:hypothetical protein NDU88_000307 [Pleurodeles waltl]|uniref:Uncharacterized protein n=1 Tax=Pleurodeles waltl TaxID=8319 RepID=A0AAV7UPL1_PLEWA|nr:hypothetical protein NDU88_000307 [Pleurodeles waltl]